MGKLTQRRSHSSALSVKRVSRNYVAGRNTRGLTLERSNGRLTSLILWMNPTYLQVQAGGEKKRRRVKRERKESAPFVLVGMLSSSII